MFVFDYINEKITDVKDQLSLTIHVVSGCVISIFTLYDVNTLSGLFSWEMAVKAAMAFGIWAGTVFGGMAAKDIYNYVKPKAIKFGNKKKLLIIKFFKHGKQKNKKRA